MILALFFVCANTFLFAQGTGADTLSSSPHRTNGEDSINAYLATRRLVLKANIMYLSPGAAYNVTKRLTIWGQAGFPWVVTGGSPPGVQEPKYSLIFNPTYIGGVRYYYNFEKRAKAQKRIDGFSGNYFGLMWLIPLQKWEIQQSPWGLAWSEPTIHMLLAYGFQRPIGKYGYIDMGLGIGPKYETVSKQFILSFNAHYKNEPLWYFIGMTTPFWGIGLRLEKIFNKDRYGLPDKIQRMPPGAGKSKRLPKRYRYSEESVAEAVEYLDSRRLMLKANLVHLSAAAEYSLAPRLSAWGQVGFPWTATYYAFLEELQFRFNPAYLGGLRYYHNFEKRAGYQKRIDGFSGNYAGLMWEVPLKWQLITYNNGFELQPVIQLLGVYGIQRPLGKYGYIDLGVGMGPKYTTLSKDFYLSEYDGIETGAFNYIWGMLSFQVNGGLRLEKIWSKDKDSRRRKFR